VLQFFNSFHVLNQTISIQNFQCFLENKQQDGDPIVLLNPQSYCARSLTERTRGDSSDNLKVYGRELSID
jgi:hypothetical protein